MKTSAAAKESAATKAEEIRGMLEAVSTVEKREYLPKFFKALPGGYGEGDKFIGVVVPEIRIIAKAIADEDLDLIEELFDSEYHECRLCGALALVYKFNKTKSETARQEIHRFYLAHTKAINNWDLVDLSCRDIVGGYLLGKADRSILRELAGSSNLWEQRIAVVATYAFIRHREFEDTLELCEKLLRHPHDLMHKACGWMLREIGKRDKDVLLSFLDKYHKSMPRTMLRYSIEKFDANERAHYMAK